MAPTPQQPHSSNRSGVIRRCVVVTVLAWTLLWLLYNASFWWFPAARPVSPRGPAVDEEAVQQAREEEELQQQAERAAWLEDTDSAGEVDPIADEVPGSDTDAGEDGDPDHRPSGTQGPPPTKKVPEGVVAARPDCAASRPSAPDDVTEPC
eukprot:scaffold1680_cov391-Prasinococcus_capsulatus_cf.AAC.1